MATLERLLPAGDPLGAHPSVVAQMQQAREAVSVLRETLAQLDLLVPAPGNPVELAPPGTVPKKPETWRAVPFGWQLLPEGASRPNHA